MTTEKLEAIFLTRDSALFTAFRSRFAESGVALTMAADQGALARALREGASAAIVLDAASSQGTLGLQTEEAVARLAAMLGHRIILVLAEPAAPAAQVVKLLELGAHDVVQKPVNPRVLAEQLKALVRVFSRAPERKKSVIKAQAEALTMDYQRRRCYLREDAGGGRTEVRLTKLEFQVLYMLLQKKGGVITYEEFAEHLWPAAASYREITHVLHQVVTNIRRKTAASRARIENLRAEGFRLG